MNAVLSHKNELLVTGDGIATVVADGMAELDAETKRLEGYSFKKAASPSLSQVSKTDEREKASPYLDNVLGIVNVGLDQTCLAEATA